MVRTKAYIHTAELLILLTAPAVAEIPLPDTVGYGQITEGSFIDSVAAGEVAGRVHRPGLEDLNVVASLDTEGGSSYYVLRIPLETDTGAPGRSGAAARQGDLLIGLFRDGDEVLSLEEVLSPGRIVRLPPMPPGHGPFLVRGNCNSDSAVDISDAIYLLGFLFLGESEPLCVNACDSNDDNRRDVSDAVYTLSFLFAGGPTIPPPYPGCGADPTVAPVGQLSCAVSHCGGGGAQVPGEGGGAAMKEAGAKRTGLLARERAAVGKKIAEDRPNDQKHLHAQVGAGHELGNAERPEPTEGLERDGDPAGSTVADSELVMEVCSEETEGIWRVEVTFGGEEELERQIRLELSYPDEQFRLESIELPEWQDDHLVLEVEEGLSPGKVHLLVSGAFEGGLLLPQDEPFLRIAMAETRVIEELAGEIRLEVLEGLAQGDSLEVEFTPGEYPPDACDPWKEWCRDYRRTLRAEDLYELLGHIFLAAPAPPCVEVLDADGDGRLGVQDALLIIPEVMAR